MTWFFDFWRAVRFLRLLVPTSGLAMLNHLRGKSPWDGQGTRIRGLLQRQGLTSIKLGQYLALRHDLIPKELCEELEKLFEQAAPIEPAAVRRIIESELHDAIESRFQSFDFEPLASASVAQVHTATLHSGERVAVKVQRESIREIFQSDIRILKVLAWAIEGLGWAGTLPLMDAVCEFEQYTRNELDFRLEGRTAERMREEARSHEIIPRIFWELTTSKVLTLEFIDGMSFAELHRALRAGEEKLIQEKFPGLNLATALHNLTFASLHQLFVTGFFHGDPHPGNILLCQDNRVAFIDFGIFGELTTRQRDLLKRYTFFLAHGHVYQSFREISKIYAPTQASSPHRFRRDAERALGNWYAAAQNERSPGSERHLGRAFDSMVGVVRRHHYRAPMEYLLFWRAIITLDALALRVSPAFDLTAEVRKFFLNRMDAECDLVGSTARAAFSALANRKRAEKVDTSARNLAIQQEATPVASRGWNRDFRLLGSVLLLIPVGIVIPAGAPNWAGFLMAIWLIVLLVQLLPTRKEFR